MDKDTAMHKEMQESFNFLLTKVFAALNISFP